MHGSLLFCAVDDGVVLFVGGAKLFSASGFVGSAESLAVQDSLFGIPYWLLMEWEEMAVFC